MNTKILPEGETETKDAPLFRGKKRAVKKSGVNWKVYAGLFVAGMGLSVWALIIAAQSVSGWYDEHRVVFHPIVEVKFNPLFTVENRVVSPVVETKEVGTPVSSPTPKPQGMKLGEQVLAAESPVSHKDIIMGKKHGDIMWTMYGLESTYGKVDPCAKQGKFNGFGYIPGNCYEYFEQVAFRVDNWLEEKLAIYDLPTTLCGYNLGFKSEHMSECVAQSADYPYYRDYLALGGKI